MPDMIPAARLEDFAAHLAALAADPDSLMAPAEFREMGDGGLLTRIYQQGKAEAYRSMACYIRRCTAGQVQWPKPVGGDNHA